MSFAVKRPMRRRARVAVAIGAACGLSVWSCAPGSLPNFTTPQIPDTADYTIDNVRIFAPPGKTRTAQAS